jgi:surface polysaccharide O-acyltransferase-like enzyme
MLGKTDLIQNLVFSGIWFVLIMLILYLFKNKFSFKLSGGHIFHIILYTIALPFNFQLYKDNCYESKDYDDALGVYFYWIVFLGNKVYYTFHK